MTSFASPEPLRDDLLWLYLHSGLCGAWSDSLTPPWRVTYYQVLLILSLSNSHTHTFTRTHAHTHMHTHTHTRIHVGESVRVPNRVIHGAET